MVSSVVNLVHFYSHSRFVPSDVSVPVLLLALTGLAACSVAALGWCGAMAGNTCGLYTVRDTIIAKIKHVFTEITRSSENSRHKIHVQ
jgi:hypothetical protein